MEQEKTSIPAGTWDTIWADPRWIVMDRYALSHYHPKSRSNTAAIEGAVSATSAAGMPAHATFHAFCKYLAMQCQMLKVKHFLEVGTLGGLTPIWLATMNPDLKVTTVENNPAHAEVARKNIEAAGVSDRVELIVGSAVEVLPKLVEEVKAGTRPRLGMAYIDADKQNNWAYFEWSLQMSHPGASIYVDNVVRQGKVIGEAFQDEPGVKGSREVIEKAGKDPRVESVVMQTVCEKEYDGFLWALVKEDSNAV